MRTSLKKAVVLLSGGLDSATTLALAVRDGFEPHALSFRYGQRHAVELEAAVRVAHAFHVASHRTVELDARVFLHSALTDTQLQVPKDRDDAEMENGIPVTYVPARNTIFLSYALALAESLGSTDIFIGVNAVDYSGYPDCRPEFIAAFEAMANLATKHAIEGKRLRIHTPLIHLTKAEIIQLGNSLGVDYALTLSCYDPDSQSRACGHCDSCRLRARGFTDAQIPDPTRYMS